MACLKHCRPFLCSPPCSIPSSEGLSSWPAPRQPSGTATPPHSQQHKTSAPVKQSGNIQLPRKYFQPAPGGEGLWCLAPIHNPVPWTLASMHTVCWKSWSFIKKQMLESVVLGSFLTTARAAARQQPQGQLSTGTLESVKISILFLITGLWIYAVQNLGNI